MMFFLYMGALEVEFSPVNYESIFPVSADYPVKKKTKPQYDQTARSQFLFTGNTEGSRKTENNKIPVIPSIKSRQ